MNLYQVMTNHYAPKDSHKAIWAYVIAESNESLYEYLKSEPRIEDEIGSLYLSWGYKEDENEDSEDFKSEILLSCDEEETSSANYDDLFYGRTFTSWKVVKIEIEDEEIELLKYCGIRLLDSRI